MKAIRHAAFGAPDEVLVCETLDDPPPPGPGEIALEMLFAPINPADLLRAENRYGETPELPAIPGFEGVGRVAAVGEGVDGVAVGALACPLAASTWRQRITCPAKRAMILPPDVDLHQAAMIKANPATAWAMLQVADLKPGERLIQNAANSAVGRLVARFAGARGIETVNLVRREESAALFEGVPHATALVCDPADADAVRRAGPAQAAFDAVGGAASEALTGALDESGLLLVYGLLSGAPSRIGPIDLVFRDIRVQGFWLKRWAEAAEPATLKGLYGELIGLLQAGALDTPVERVYPMDEIAAAAAHAARPGRSGKILLDLR
ncbi:MAG: zinc-dependent alcohol dehydrogenase family protein [Alphaproteobacteria bacterium]|nr:zinc-dependent alcohol dehydrogenase family protein [Alphaproteobacteria bacterium]